jgi:alpha-beta hydrolase superfamily lysophospholipase
VARLPAYPQCGRVRHDDATRRKAEGDACIADPFCGIRFAPASASEALAGVRRGADQNAKLTLRTLLIDAYRAAGLDLTLKVHPGGRHEMLDETNRDELVGDRLAWLDATLEQATSS